MEEETAFENSWLVTLTLDRVILHTSISISIFVY